MKYRLKINNGYEQYVEAQIVSFPVQMTKTGYYWIKGNCIFKNKNIAYVCDILEYC